MRPTFSIIFFTVASGAGYGMWVLIALACLLTSAGYQAGDGITLIRWPVMLFYGITAGFLLVSAGLVSSLGHLGQPQRAWRAFSQWRSSWLSREGVAAALTYLPAITIGFAVVKGNGLDPDVSGAHAFAPALFLPAPLWIAAILLLLVGSLATLYCTANIYASLKPIRAWNNHYVVASYLVIGTYSGGLLAWALTTLPPGRFQPIHLLVGIIVFSIAAGLLKLAYWRFLDQGSPLSTADATGLGGLGVVRSFEQPHTEQNYLTHEMGFRIARKHSHKLRAICLIAGFAVPGILALLSLVIPDLGVVAAWLALLGGTGGLVVERWLFFAEAKHTVMLYYGSRQD